MSIFSMAASNPAAPTYPLQRSVRLRSSASAYFNRTLTTATDSKIWTWSSWIKIGGVPTYNPIFAAGTTGSAYAALWFNNGTLVLYAYTGATVYHLVTTAVYRDPSAWYHIQVAFNSTEATASNRVKIYVNGVQVTAFTTATYPSLNYATYFNTAVAHNIGQYTPAGVGYFDGYLTEVNFIDGQALTPSSFGAYNSYGVWSPAKYTGSYGTNGFYLSFQDNSALTTTANVGIGADSSGNGNYWTSNNISLTAGVTYDSMLDVPTNSSNTNANYCTLSPIDTGGGSVTLSGANLNYSIASSTGSQVRGTMGTDLTSKWYWEYTAGSVASPSNPQVFGISTVDGPITNNSSALRLAATIYTDGGTNYLASTYINGTVTNITSQFRSAAIGDIFQIAYDAATGKLWFGKNNTWYDATNGTTGNPSTGANPVFTLPTGSSMTPFLVNLGATYSGSLNCGQRPFTYTPPTGFNRLNTYNLPDSIVPVGAQYFAATLWTGTGVARNITNTVNGFSMQPDMVWLKNRNSTQWNNLHDSVRGANATLYSNATNAEASYADSVTGFNSTGFGVGTDSSGVGVNTNTNTYVGWQWRASNASAVTNTSGTISSQVSANQTAGFSVVNFTGMPISAGVSTIGHGLGVAPNFIIIKNRDIVDGWYCYNSNLGNAAYILLNSSAVPVTGAVLWGNTSPTSSVFSLRNNGLNTTTTQNLIAYCFAAVRGYSAFGSYTGNGSADGPFIYTGFRPRWLMIKKTDSSSDWWIWDTSRSTFNQMQSVLYANLSAAEFTGSTFDFDALSNGFKNRSSNVTVNGSGATYIYAAFAENPFKNSLAR